MKNEILSILFFPYILFVVALFVKWAISYWRKGIGTQETVYHDNKLLSTFFRYNSMAILRDIYISVALYLDMWLLKRISTDAINVFGKNNLISPYLFLVMLLLLLNAIGYFILDKKGRNFELKIADIMAISFKDINGGDKKEAEVETTELLDFINIERHRTNEKVEAFYTTMIKHSDTLAGNPFPFEAKADFLIENYLLEQKKYRESNLKILLLQECERSYELLKSEFSLTDLDIHKIKMGPLPLKPFDAYYGKGILYIEDYITKSNCKYKIVVCHTDPYDTTEKTDILNVSTFLYMLELLDNGDVTSV